MDVRRGLTALPSRRGHTHRTRISIDTLPWKRTTTRPMLLPVSSVPPHPSAVTILSTLLDLLPGPKSIRDIHTRPLTQGWPLQPYSYPGAAAGFWNRPNQQAGTSNVGTSRPTAATGSGDPFSMTPARQPSPSESSSAPSTPDLVQMACSRSERSTSSKPQIYTRRKLRPKRNDSSGTDKPHRQTRNTHSYQSTTTRVYNFRFYLKFHRIYMESHLTLIQLRRHSTLTKPSIISLISNSRTGIDTWNHQVRRLVVRLLFRDRVD